MHSDYITKCCITNRKDKLLLLKYSNIDITDISPIMMQLTLELMNQCYSHVGEFHELNRLKNKRYHKIEPKVVEQLKDMLYIEKKFVEYFSTPGSKNKQDLLTYVMAFQISNNYYNEYIYNILVNSLKKEFTNDFWEDNNLTKHELNTLGFSDFYILRDKKEECSTGQVDMDLEKPVNILDRYLANNKTEIDPIDNKLSLIKAIGNTLDNYYNEEFTILNNPYKDRILELVDNVKVSKDISKSTAHIKRI